MVTSSLPHQPTSTLTHCNPHIRAPQSASGRNGEVATRTGARDTAALGGRRKGAKEELEGMLERFLFCGDDRNIRRVYVQGRLVGGKEFAQ